MSRIRFFWRDVHDCKHGLHGSTKRIVLRWHFRCRWPLPRGIAQLQASHATCPGPLALAMVRKVWIAQTFKHNGHIACRNQTTWINRRHDIPKAFVQYVCGWIIETNTWYRTPSEKEKLKGKNNSKFIERTEKHQVHHQDTAPWYSKVKSSSFAPRQQANFFSFKVVPLLSQVPTVPKARFFVLHAGDDNKSWKTDIILNIYIYVHTFVVAILISYLRIKSNISKVPQLKQKKHNTCQGNFVRRRNPMVPKWQRGSTMGILFPLPLRGEVSDNGLRSSHS